MHIELSAKYKSGLTNIIKNLEIDAHLIDSFNASGETITLSASREEIEQILEAGEDDFNSPESNEANTVTLQTLKELLKDQLADIV